MYYLHWSQEHDRTLHEVTDYLGIMKRADNTIDAYIRGIKDFLQRTPKPLEEIDPEDVFRYLVSLEKERGLAGNTLNQRRAALKILFDKVLKKPLPEKVGQYSKKSKHIPEILESDEATSFFNSCPDFRLCTIFMTLYSAGLRLSEATHLRAADIDSSNMIILVRAGKGCKDRKTLLSERLLTQLREYWQRYRPKDLLFPRRSDPQIPIDSSTVQRACKNIARAAGIKKNVTPHTFRHSFAAELLKSGVNLRYIQELLGHASLQSTLIYLRVVPECLKVTSPLDRLDI